MMTRGRHPYIIQRDGDGRVRQMTLNIPAPLVHHIPEDATFAAELVDEGILFRFTGLVSRGENGVRALAADVPTWITEGGST